MNRNKKEYHPLEKYIEKDYKKGRERRLPHYKLKIVEGIYNKKVLDIGCGCGSLGELLIKQNNNVFGLDISKTAVKKANSKGIKSFVCDIEKDLYFKDKFDTIIMFDVLEHVLDPVSLLNRAKDLLKEDGELLVLVPNEMSLIYKLNAFLGRSFQELIYLNNGYAEHHTIFTKKLAEIIFKLSNFKHFKVNYDNFTWKYLVNQTIFIKALNNNK